MNGPRAWVRRLPGARGPAARSPGRRGFHARSRPADVCYILANRSSAGAAPISIPSTPPGFRSGSAGHFRSYQIRVDLEVLAGDGCGRTEVSASSTVLLPYAPASVAVARRRLTTELLGAGIREPAAHDAALVMSELLSNALRHANPLPDGHVRVGWRLDADMLEVTVSDGGAVTRPHASRASLSSLGGRGLSIVTHLTWQWGVRTEDGGCTTVWAVLPVQPVNGRGPGNIRGVTQRQSGDTHGDALTCQSDGSGGDREPHPRRGQRGRPARHGPAAPSGHGAAADNPTA
ncbi:MAG TPA: ATP-binding protein [Streptosporangiaceae bacterium]|nr:ATP-binding protein [Streptosporangiaceae bacterium]